MGIQVYINVMLRTELDASSRAVAIDIDYPNNNAKINAECQSIIVANKRTKSQATLFLSFPM
jgi:frataxin-like iron-binding protein CyaY